MIISDDYEAMKELRDFLAKHHITNVATDSYTLDWGKKTITIAVYPENKSEIKIINDYIKNTEIKVKQVFQKT